MKRSQAPSRTGYVPPRSSATTTPTKTEPIPKKPKTESDPDEDPQPMETESAPKLKGTLSRRFRILIFSSCT